MNQNKITFAINPNQNKKVPQMDGMIALKKIQNYSYALTDEIGLGFSSRVYRGKNDLNNEVVAIKVIDLRKEDELSKQFVNQEINILQTIKLRNPQNLLKLFDVFKTKNNLYIITQFCQGKDCAKLLRKKKCFSQVQAQSILRQLLNAYRQLYQLQIVHRDLKLANVFIKKGVIKLADFGFAIRAQSCNQKFDYNVGSPYYMPPQSLKFNRYSYKSDVWSFGVIAYEMVFGRLPWKQKVESVLFEKINSTPIEELFDPEVQLTDHYKYFIRSCLQVDFDRRATPEFIITYEWPQAQDYVDGVESQNGAYKPLSMVKIPSANAPQPKAFGTANAIEQQGGRQQKIFKVHHQISLPASQSRDKSPNSKYEFKQHFNFDEGSKNKIVFRENSQKVQTTYPQNVFAKLGMNIENNPIIQINNVAQISIVNQIHYCRFMARLYELLDETFNTLPQGYLLKNEIANKIIGKCDILMKLVHGDNILMIQKFYQYKNTQRWRRLQQTIENYDRKYRDKFTIDYRSEVNDQILVNSIKYLKNTISINFHLLQELTYFYQLRQLQKRNSPSYFAVNSKLEVLCSRKLWGKPEQVSPMLCQRLSHRISLLGIV